jgi:lipopolysaccharide/colanic/teichoic acid biosynthesis glycosyltransferase
MRIESSDGGVIILGDVRNERAFCPHSLVLPIARVESPGGSKIFWWCKRGFDLTVAILALPIVACLALVLLLVNPFWNPGPLFFRQERMGRDCGRIVVWKFRTMRASEIRRGPEDPVEAERITPLGGWLRRTRLDEMPQLFNVIRGEMSLIGPRPDTIDHALAYLETVPGYAKRYWLRPGISGLAQVRVGYAEGSQMTALKTRHDLDYIRHAGWRLEISIILRTFMVLSTGFGAR